MDPITKDAVDRLDGLLQRVGLDEQPPPLSQYNYLEGGRGTSFTISALVLIDSITGPSSHYAGQAKASVERSGPGHHWAVADIHAVLVALRHDLTEGNLRGLQDRVRGDTFEDFLEMAEYLLDEGYKDAAAVVTGSVLEGHLRALATNRSIATIKSNGSPVKAEALNADLASVNVYSRGDLKSVTAWLDIRNHAAHGHYHEYTNEQVKLMHSGVRDFLNRVPA